MESLVEIRSYSPETGSHRHAFHQLILPCEGVMELETGRGNGRVSETVAAFVAAGEDHNFLATRSGRFIVLDLPDDSAAAPARTFFHIDPAMRGLLDYFRQARPEAGLSAAWVSLFLDRLGHLTAPVDQGAAALERALAHLRDHLDRPLRIEEIAREAGVSASRLHRITRAHLGATPHGCLAKLRLERAEELLAEGRLSIAEIALATGHADQTALTRAFKRDRGLTPAGLRRMLRAS